VTNQIRAQLEEHEGVASMDLGVDAMDVYTPEEQGGDEIPECRVILSVSFFSTFVIPIRHTDIFFGSFFIFIGFANKRLTSRSRRIIFWTILNGICFLL
jgi:hypothetical protein